jgi:hypothetical protein
MYMVKGLGKRKKLLIQSGGNLFDMAVAMLETENMLAIPSANYPFGDKYPNGHLKTGDAANFGIFKQNWGMIKAAWFPWRTANWRSGAVLNYDLAKDIQILHECIRHFIPKDHWFAGHRYGTTGLALPSRPNLHVTRNVLFYRDAVLWIEGQLKKNKKYETDDTRICVDVAAI